MKAIDAQHSSTLSPRPPFATGLSVFLVSAAFGARRRAAAAARVWRRSHVTRRGLGGAAARLGILLRRLDFVEFGLPRFGPRSALVSRRVSPLLIGHGCGGNGDQTRKIVVAVCWFAVHRTFTAVKGKNKCVGGAWHATGLRREAAATTPWPTITSPRRLRSTTRSHRPGRARTTIGGPRDHAITRAHTTNAWAISFLCHASGFHEPQQHPDLRNRCESL